MREFNEFSDSLSHVWPIAMQLQDRTPYNLNTSDWDNLKLVFSKIRCMASGTSLVGNSKIMAHLLPNLIPPVDRQYTLKFLFGNAQIKNGIDLEWHKLLLILGNFFYPIVRSQIFQSKIEKWNAQGGQFRWDTSPLKMVDNLIIGLSKIA
ncbi:hypothetical protein SAMN04515618_1304 [Collimonas sp. OK307]|nr:hypothetical protein SAMN04515618_1304 [Collimonas sp. OK307]